MYFDLVILGPKIFCFGYFGRNVAFIPIYRHLVLICQHEIAWKVSTGKSEHLYKHSEITEKVTAAPTGIQCRQKKSFHSREIVGDRTALKDYCLDRFF